MLLLVLLLFILIFVHFVRPEEHVSPGHEETEVLVLAVMMKRMVDGRTENETERSQRTEPGRKGLNVGVSYHVEKIVAEKVEAQRKEGRLMEIELRKDRSGVEEESLNKASGETVTERAGRLCGDGLMMGLMEATIEEGRLMEGSVQPVIAEFNYGGMDQAEIDQRSEVHDGHFLEQSYEMEEEEQSQCIQSHAALPTDIFSVQLPFGDLRSFDNPLSVGRFALREMGHQSEQANSANNESQAERCENSGALRLFCRNETLEGHSFEGRHSHVNVFLN